MHVCIFSNDEESELGLFGDLFDEWGIKVYRLSRHEPSHWIVPEETDLFVHLGSSWSTYWKSVRDEVEAEMSVIRDAVLRGVPVLGVCFGAQLLSQTFGGIVQRGQRSEIGWHGVQSSTTNSPIAGRWMQWHYDTFSAPDGFEILATNEAGIQAIRRGRLLGVQFHPEANESVVTTWVEGGGGAELASLGISPSELIVQTRQEVPRSTVASRSLLEWFLDEVANGS